MDKFLSKFKKKTKLWIVTFKTSKNPLHKFKISMNKTIKKYNFYLINVIKRLKKYKIKLISIGKKQL